MMFYILLRKVNIYLEKVCKAADRWKAVVKFSDRYISNLLKNKILYLKINHLFKNSYIFDVTLETYFSLTDC